MRESQRFVTVNDGTRLNVVVYEADTSAIAPDAPRRSMLLLHGWSNAGRVWGDFADAMLLADPDWRLFAPDLRGFGDSDKPESGYDSATFADDALAAAQALFGADGAWSLAGHSMSGKIAQIVASRHPAGLKSLILLTPSPLKTDPLPDDLKASRSAAHESAEGVRGFVEILPAHPLPAATVDWLIEDGLRAAPAAWNAWIYTIRDEDQSAASASIAVPTLVVGGGRDSRMTPAQAESVAKGIAGARFEMLPGSGHLPHLEEPNALAALVVNFLDGSLPPPADV